MTNDVTTPDKVAAFKLGMLFAAKEYGVPAEAVSIFMKLSEHVMRGNIRTPSDVVKCLDTSVTKVAAQSNDTGSMALHGLGGAGAGAATAYVMNKVRELLSSRENDREQEIKRKRALLLGSLAGAGLGLSKYYSDRGQVSPLMTPTSISL